MNITVSRKLPSLLSDSRSHRVRLYNYCLKTATNWTGCMCGIFFGKVAHQCQSSIVVWASNVFGGPCAVLVRQRWIRRVYGATGQQNTLRSMLMFGPTIKVRRLAKRDFTTRLVVLVLAVRACSGLVDEASRRAAHVRLTIATDSLDK
jgi:hypothetical protein